MTRGDLIAFEAEMADRFNAGQIKAPLHLAGGNEDQLIEIFREIRPTDWVLGGWRSHYHALLKGVPPDRMRSAILDGRSIALCFPDYRVLCSALVGGIAPLAVGLAWASKQQFNAADHVHGEPDRVWCFLGDMSEQSGVVVEAMKYASGHDLPVRWVIEDNGLSVCTDTVKAWGGALILGYESVIRYRYKLSHAHVGTGKWVAF